MSSRNSLPSATLAHRFEIESQKPGKLWGEKNLVLCAPFSNLNFFVKNQNTFAIESMNFINSIAKKIEFCIFLRIFDEFLLTKSEEKQVEKQVRYRKVERK